MSLGYIIQTLLFNEAPHFVSILGASMMLSAVMLMAVARWLSHDEQQLQQVRSSSVVPEASESTAGNDFDDNESLASFIASEFSGLSIRSSSSSMHSSVRQRRSALKILGP